MRRRSYLARASTIALVPLLAGCLGGGDSDADDTATPGTDEQDSNETDDDDQSTAETDEDSPVLSPAGKLPTGQKVTFKVQTELEAGERARITVENTFETSGSNERFIETDVLEVNEDGVLTVTYDIPDDLPEDEEIRIRVEEADADGGILVNERKEIE